MPATDKSLQLRGAIDKAVQIYANTPDVTHEQVALMCGISEKSLYSIRRDPNFWDAVYEAYMVEYSYEEVQVLRAMVREAKAGNVQAGRLVLEHGGKLQKNIHVTIDSPFEKWLKKADIGDVQDAEIVDDVPIELQDFSELPERKKKDDNVKAKEDHSKVRKALEKAEKLASKKAKRNLARKELRKWQRRANLAEIEPLPARRPTKGQRKAWEDSIIEAEQRMASERSQEQADSNKTLYKQKNQKQEALEPPIPPKT